MANVKKIIVPYIATGASLDIKIMRMVDGYWLDNSDGTFKAVPVSPHVPLTELSESIYRLQESRAVWDDGEYDFFGYLSTGGIVASGRLFIVDDSEVSDSEMYSDFKALRQIETGSWEIKANQMIFYASDGVTAQATFNLFSSTGDPAMSNIFKRVKV